MLMWIGGIALVSVISLQSALYFSKSTDKNMLNSIAVFPFEMIKGDVADEWLKDHFSESLTFQLGSMKNIKIIDRLQIRKALNKYEKPKQAGIAELATEIGKDIGANLVLLGNYSIIENEILIITKIVNSKTGETTPLIKKQYNLELLEEFIRFLFWQTLLNSNFYPPQNVPCPPLRGDGVGRGPPEPIFIRSAEGATYEHSE